MRIATEFTSKKVEERLYFDPATFDAEMRVAAFALQKFGVVTEGGLRARVEDSDMAAWLQRDLNIMRARVSRGYPLDGVFYIDREATLIEDSVRKLGELPLENLADADAYMRDRAAEITAAVTYGPAGGAVQACELRISSPLLID